MEDGVMSFLLENKQAYLDEIVVFFFEEYNTIVFTSTLYLFASRSVTPVITFEATGYLHMSHWEFPQST